MDNETLRWAVGFVFLVGTTVYTWYSSTQRATKDEVEEHGRKIAALEVKLQNMPNQNDFHKLQLDVVEMKGEQRVFAEQIKPVAVSVKRIEEYLIQGVQTSVSARTRK